jgi:two-component system, OmpR family, phosphate regulon sensor histidine kinase PhoR
MTQLLSADAAKILVAALSDAALVVNARSTVIAANDLSIETMAASLEGAPIALFLRSPDVLAALANTLESAAHHVVKLIVHSAIQRVLDVYISPLGRDGDGPLALIILRDRTREEQIERMRTDFVANASHELRTPLTTLSGFIETMQGAASKDEKARSEFLKLMKTQAERMSGLIDDLLSLSRIELDEHVVPSSNVNLSVVIKQTQDLLSPLVAETGVFLDVQVPDQLLVRGDSNQLAQVVHNLIENAIKYAGSGKSIAVSGGIEGPTVFVAIKDNGPGIAAHHIPRLTERFYRVNVQDSRTRGGTGLGLAICKHIVLRHRGKLLIESEVGHGSTFTMQFPVSI